MKTSETINILKLIEEGTFQTGTMAYGLPDPSDHDRFCTKATFSLIVEALKENSIEMTASSSGGVSRSIVFDVGGEHFNVFSVNDDQIDIYETITAMMKKACKTFPKQGSCKPLRIHLFRIMLDTFTMWKATKKTAVDNDTGMDFV